jgi:hypothetical protein
MAIAIYTAARMSLLLIGWVIAFAVAMAVGSVWPPARFFVMAGIGALWTFTRVMIVRREAERAMLRTE